MAENDKRIESLEDEVKVLKGEVKRTLVDLRALLMREDSPLNEASSTRRAAAPKPPEEPSVKKEVVTETVQQAVAAKPPPAPEPRPAAPPPPPVAAAPPPKPEPAPVAAPPPPPPPPIPPPVLATAGPGPGPGPGPGRMPATLQGHAGPWPAPQYPAQPSPPPPYYPAPPGPPPQDQHLADQERRLAQQERTLAQQERDLAQWTRGQARDDEDDRPRRRAKRNRGDDEDRDEPKREPKQEVPVMAAPSTPTFPWSPGPQVRPADSRPPKAREREKEAELEQPRRREEERASNFRDDPSRDHPRRPRHDEHDEDDGQDQRRHNGKGSRVFEEYWALLDEATVQSAAAEPAGAAPVDVNVIASLVYWISTAKRRLGDQKLKDLLELYLQSGHSRPGLQELLLHLHSIVAPAAEGAGQGNLEWVDLMFQLHGILTGGLPIGRMPAVALTPKPAVERPPEVSQAPTAPEVEPQPAPAPAAPQSYGRTTPPPMVAVE